MTIKRVPHDWVEVGARRWCVTRYCDGGCGAFQQRRSDRWVPAVAMTCTDEQSQGTLL